MWAIDFRGHGDTAAPANGRFDWNGMADDLQAVIEEIADGPLAVFGHSMGGAVAVMVEHRVPGTLKSAYLYEPIIVPVTGEMPLGANPMSQVALAPAPGVPVEARGVDAVREPSAAQLAAGGRSGCVRRARFH